MKGMTLDRFSGSGRWIKDLYERYGSREPGIPGIPSLYQNLDSTKKFVGGAENILSRMQLELL